MNTLIVNNKIVSFNDKSYFVLWRQKSGRPIPVGKGSYFTPQQRIEHNKKKIGELQKRRSGVSPEKQKEIDGRIAERTKNIQQIQEKTAPGGKFSELREDGNVDEFVGDGWSSWHEGLSQKDKRDLRYYKDAGYRSINETLRGKRKKTDYIDEEIKDLDNIIKKGETPKNMIVYRGFSHKEIATNPESFVGRTFTDKAFISTTLMPTIGKTFAGAGVRRENAILAKIRVPKGTKAADLATSRFGTSNLVRTEAEILLGRGTKFKISSAKRVKEEYGKYIEMELEVIK